MIRVVLPYHLRNLASVDGEVELSVDGEVCVRSVLDALEAKHPTLKGTIRDHGSLARRPLLRFFACGRDVSNEPVDSPLPDEIVQGRTPFIVLGAIAGG